jgi:hypothetical protein
MPTRSLKNVANTELLISEAEPVIDEIVFHEGGDL